MVQKAMNHRRSIGRRPDVTGPIRQSSDGRKNLMAIQLQSLFRALADILAIHITLMCVVGFPAAALSRDTTQQTIGTLRTG
jgi:hypothetical protein